MATTKEREISATPALKTSKGPFTISPPSSGGGGGSTEIFPYGAKGMHLLDELAKADWLPVYNDEAIRAIVEECAALKSLYESILQEEDRDEPKVRVTLQVLQESIYRNKRCALVYMHTRLNKLEELWWTTSSPVVPAELATKLSRAELDYYSKFQNTVSNYMDDVDMDLTSHIQPPHDLLLEVRALKDAGELLLQSGAKVILEKNATYFLRKTDVEQLIRQGYLEQV